MPISRPIPTICIFMLPIMIAWYVTLIILLLVICGAYISNDKTILASNTTSCLLLLAILFQTVYLFMMNYYLQNNNPLEDRYREMEEEQPIFPAHREIQMMRCTVDANDVNNTKIGVNKNNDYVIVINPV